MIQFLLTLQLEFGLREKERDRERRGEIEREGHGKKIREDLRCLSPAVRGPFL